MDQDNKTIEKPIQENPMFSFMAIGSIIYAFLYTILLYKNSSGITYPFFVGGTCLFFFFYLIKSGITAKKDTIFYVISLMLFGISTCLTDSWCLHFFNKLAIFILLFCMMLHCLYHDQTWDLSKYIKSICNVTVTSMAFIMHPFIDYAAYRKSKNLPEKKNKGKGKYIIIGIIISIPILIVILLLLASSDIVFASIFDYINFDLLEDFFDTLFDGNIPSIVCMLLFGFFAPYCILSRLNLHNIVEVEEDKRTGEPVIAITITAILSVVYLVFCIIQIIYLFAGFGTLPYEYTYAEYARQGFFQLVFVCLINLFLVLSCMKRFRKNIVLKILLTFISACTYIMIASSVYKMLLYINVYYLTFLRVFVLWALFVIFLLVTGVLILIFKEDFPYFKFSLVTVTVLYLVFSFARPDYWIAKYNISFCKETNDYDYPGYTDVYYLVHNLSADAAPVIYSLAEEKGYQNNGWLKNPPEKDSLRTWNLSRWIARQYYLDFTK